MTLTRLILAVMAVVIIYWLIRVFAGRPRG